MPHPSKNKGNSNERKIAEILTAWWGTEFKRTPGSGSLRWLGASWTYGDLLPPEDFLGSVECKHYKSIDLDEILRTAPTENNILGWWREAREDSNRCYQETGIWVQPILIYKQNYRPFRLVLEADFCAACGGRKLNIPAFWCSLPEASSFVILDLRQFLEVVSPQDFQRAIRKVVPQSLIERVA